MSDTIFDKIVRGEMDAYKVWENDNYLAFLTPFPNTPGFTVVIPKTNWGSYIFDLTDEQVAGLTSAAKKVAKLIERALGVERVALVYEGNGVPYVHAKLIPMHGLTDVGNVAHETIFNEEYQGYLTTLEGPKMSDEELTAIQSKIVEANK
jgi:histidine triad (HIT) family protein